MRGWLSRPLVGFAFVACLMASPVRAQSGSPYGSFRIPESHLRELQLGSFSGLSNFRSSEPEAQDDYRSRQGFLNVTTRWIDETDTRRHALSLRAEPSWSTFVREHHGDGLAVRRDERRASDVDVYWSALAASEAWYDADSRWGLETSLSGTYRYQRSGESNQSTESSGVSTLRTQSSTTRRIYDVNGSAEISVGRGRIRDVTAVLQALALEDRLIRMGTITSPLSDAVREQLAQVYAVRSQLQAAHSRPDRVFWREIWRILHDAGALAGRGLDGEAYARIQENLYPAPPFAVSNGTRLELLSEFAWIGGHTDADFDSYFQSLSGGIVNSESSSRGSLRDRRERRRARFGLGVAAARAQGFATAWRFSSSVLYGDGPARSIELLSSISVQHLLLDRWYMSAGLFHDVTSQSSDGRRSEPSWQVGASAQLSYLVEDHWSVDLQLSRFESELRGTAIAPLNSGTLGIESTNLQLGFTWRPTGRFDSPTLGISERPMATTR